MGTAAKQQKKVPKLRFSGFSGEWQINELKSLLSEPLANGEGVLTHERSIEPTKYGLVEISNIFESGINLDLRSLTFLHAAKGNALLNEGDIIINRVSIRPSGVGKVVLVGVIQKGMVLSFESNMFRVRFDKPKVYGLFFAYFSTTEYYNRQKIAKAKTGNQASLSQSDIKEFKIPLPELDEQQKIADFLGSVDAWLDNLRQQKTALETYKRGMMQKLFTQQVRFKDDSGKYFQEWENDILEKLASFFTAPHVAVDRYNKDRFWFIDMGSVSTDGHLIVKKRTSSTKNILKKGNLVMPNRDIGHGDIIGKVAYIDSDNRYILGNNMYGLTVHDNHLPKFLYYLINSEMVNRVMRVRSNGTSQLQLIRKDVGTVPVLFPSYKEQQKIANFLTAIDETITAKAEEITKVEQWKKGLKQKMFV